MLSTAKDGFFPESLLTAAITVARTGTRDVRPVSVDTCSAHSNDRAEIRFTDGTTLVLKRARYAWAAERFAASRRACRVLRKRTGIIAPDPLDLPWPDDALPVEAYWRIDQPTLGDVWPHLAARERGWALRHWGRLAARVHGVRFTGHGSLARGELGSLAGWLEADLGRRLLPAVRASWPEGVPLVDTLLERSVRVASRVDREAVLVHNDLHMMNVLCERRKHCARAVGVLDLEAAFAGPAEADLAHMEVLHGPLFGRPLPAGWLEEVREGYGRELDPVVLAFFRACHLANFGYHAALCGWSRHTADVLAAAVEEV